MGRWKGKLIQTIEGLSYPIEIFQNDKLRWMCFGSKNIQSAQIRENPAALVLDYLQPMLGVFHFRRQARSCFIFGLGGGTLVNYLQRYYAELMITAIEHDAQVVKVAHDYFSLAAASDLFHIETMDALAFIQQSPLKTDIMFVDLFSPDHIPAPLYDTNFYTLCKERLNSNGVLVANLLCPAKKDFLQILRCIRLAFEYRTLCIAVAGHNNTIVFAFNDPSYTKKIDSLARRNKLIEPQLDLELGVIAQRIGLV